jgi:hypothetical protein
MRAVYRVLIGSSLAVYLLASLATDALGACRWTWDCSSGTCRQVQICDGALDLPAIRPPGIPPLASPSIAPIPQPVIPPIGTSECRQAQLCDNLGRCRWETVCR